MRRRRDADRVFVDDAYWLFHDDQTGRSRVATRSAGLALAATVLAELLADRLVVVAAVGGTPSLEVAAAPTPARGGDHVAAEVWAQIEGEARPHPVGTWLEVLSPDIGERLGHAMARRGVARVHRNRRLVRRHVTYLPTDEVWAVWPLARLSSQLRYEEELDPRDVFLFGLAGTTTLVHELLLDAGPSARERAEGQLAGLWPPWAEVLRQTRIAVDSAVLTHRD